LNEVIEREISKKITPTNEEVTELEWLAPASVPVNPADDPAV